MAVLNPWRGQPCRETETRSRGWWFFFAWLLVAGPSSLAQPLVSKEYQVKAAFLFNFAQFVEWPTNAFSTPQSPLVIGILGNDPFGRFLDELVRGETVNGRSLVIHRYRRVEECEICHILFISTSEARQVEQILAKLKGRSLLTVAEMDAFANRGGMIRFVTEQNKIRFRINVDATKAGGLTVSSKLLKAAAIVPSRTD
jgi:hypothetical protein